MSKRDFPGPDPEYMPEPPSFKTLRRDLVLRTIGPLTISFFIDDDTCLPTEKGVQLTDNDSYTLGALLIDVSSAWAGDLRTVHLEEDQQTKKGAPQILPSGSFGDARPRTGKSPARTRPVENKVIK